MSAPIWLAFTPAYATRRSVSLETLGAHAFRDDAPRSLCGYVERDRVGAEADGKARRCSWCERVAAGRAMDRSGAAAPVAAIRGTKRWAPGTDPLAPMPYTEAERDDLVRRVRELTRVAATTGAKARTGMRMSPRRLAAARAERAAAAEQARAHARSLAGRST